MKLKVDACEFQGERDRRGIQYVLRFLGPRKLDTNGGSAAEGFGRVQAIIQGPGLLPCGYPNR